MTVTSDTAAGSNLVENTTSAAPVNDAKTSAKQPATSLMSLFDNMNNSSVGLGGLLGIRSGAMAQLPSFRVSAQL